MSDSLNYVYNNAASSDYTHSYYGTQQPSPNPMLMAHFYQPDHGQRKRPKYTRSKTGCLTCRGKKVKCDEEKPDCARCRGSNRECVWPDIASTRKRSTRRDARPSQSPSVDARPSTAGSSGPSETSTPPTRHFTPPKAEPVDFMLPPLTSRRAVDTEYPDVHHGYERDYRTDQRIPDIQGYTVPHASSAAASSMAHPPQYYATHHHHHPRSHTMPIQQYLPSAPVSHSPQLQYSGHMHPDSVKTEHSPEWEAAMASQHVDPIHPFVYPAIHDFYSSREPVPVSQAPHHMAYSSYMPKYQ